MAKVKPPKTISCFLCAFLFSVHPRFLLKKRHRLLNKYLRTSKWWFFIACGALLEFFASCSVVNTFDPFLCRLWLVGSSGFLCINCRILSITLFLHMNPRSITLRQTPTTASNVMTVHKFNALLSSLLGNAYQLIKKDTFQFFLPFRSSSDTLRGFIWIYVWQNS